MWTGQMLVTPRKEVAEAAQYGGIDFEGYPIWMMKAMREDKLISEGEDGKDYFYTKHTGLIPIHIGDWIVRNKNGRMSVMSTTIFDEMYASVEYNYMDPHTGYRF